MIVSIREEEKRRQFLFFREGYLVKKRTVDAESMDRNSIENVLREVLRSYFVDRGLYEILGKVGNLRLNEYNLFMRWLEEHSQAEPNCTIRFLTRKELNQIDHDLVKKITLELLD